MVAQQTLTLFVWVQILVPQPTVLTLIDAGRINPDSIRSLGFFVEKFSLKTNRCQWVFSRVVTDSNHCTAKIRADFEILLSLNMPFLLKKIIVNFMCLT